MRITKSAFVSLLVIVTGPVAFTTPESIVLVPISMLPKPLVIEPPFNAPTDVMLVWAAVCSVPVNVPPLIAPVVVIVLEPLLIVPKPLVIEPPFNAPTDVMLVWAAVCSVPVNVVAVTPPVTVRSPLIVVSPRSWRRCSSS